MTNIELWHGDCLELMKNIPDESIDMILTDPPYKTITGGDSNGANSVRPKGMLSGNRKLFQYQNQITISEWIPELYRDYYREAKDNILSQNLKDIIFINDDYRNLKTTNSVIYCDPPYENQKQYANSLRFDYDEFWNYMRRWSKNNIVIISELNAPEDFECIWEKSVSRSIKSTDKSRDTEKLFTYKG